ncbi:hypothetical protein TanjilG_12039 [Lupinus angustifolius]|uniref:Uncharacterized protein n=1 Tax=Lupinus angustifolius TaxID=3871 RepID=A0A1J7GXX2_LUPAN|nr:PREDICTED: zinc finger protein CONSTANS-LIKE 2-like [Lupinus angustifolius]OIW05448.1 hypothetical protein TanjilG_12039 [Lupinus angustifolius]
MLEDDTKAIRTAGCNNWPSRICDTCHAATCTVFCRVDSAYLCAKCDTRVHTANHMKSRHERVWVCEACQHAPAAFLCKADAALLCSSCDAYIHSANSLTSRHHRVPILPISGFLHGPPNTTIQDDGFESGHKEDEGVDVEDENEAASWLLLNPVKNNSSNNTNEQSNGFMFDEYLDQVDYNSCGDNYRQQNQHQQQGQNFQLGLDFDQSPRFSYNGSIAQSVSVSSIDVVIVPESTMRDVLISHPSPTQGTIDLLYGPSCHLTPMDREARVLRYREKKKTRKFEKTIRYASRKAYAETRPRVKGRFAKRTDVEAEVDQMFSSSLITEVEYGIVPSF